MSYNLNQLATITGLTTRTLRNYLKLEFLKGEKIDGNWTFTEEEVGAFMAVPAVKQAIDAKNTGVIFDFLADAYKKSNRICTVLDFPVAMDEAMEISRFFCQEINQNGSDIVFKFSYERNLARVILSGAEESVMDILNAYYGRKRD